MTATSKKVNFFKSIKLRAWLGIFILSILSLICFGLYAFDALGDVSRDILIEGSIQAFQQVKYEVDQYVTGYDNLIKYLASDERFKKSDEEAVEAMRHMDQAYESIERIIYVDALGNLKAHSKRESDSYTQMTISEKLLAKSSQSFMFAPEAFLIKVKLSEEAESDAIIATVSFLQLRKSLEGITFGTNFRYFLVTESGEDILEQPNFPKDVIADLMSRPCGAYDLFPETYAEGISPQIAISLPILHYNLRIFVFQNAGEVYAIARKLGNNTLNFVWMLGLASFILAIYLSWSITAPVTIIADKATELSDGAKDVSVNIERDDEIGFLAKSFNSMSQNITRRITEVNALYKVTHYISASANSKMALDLCLEHIVEIFKAKRGSIMLLNEEHTALVVESFKVAKPAVEADDEEDFDDDAANLENNTEEIAEEPNSRFELKIGEGIAGQVAATGEPILCMDCSTDDRFKDYDKDSEKSTKTLVAVPLSVQGKVIGVVNLADRSNSQPFTDDDLNLLKAIATQMAMSIDNARLHNLSVINEQTSLYVRRFLEIRLDDEIKRSKRFGFPLSVVMFSIDGFSELNSKNGKNSCEAALYEMGRLLKKTVRATDIPAEYDTNKLCAILAHTTEEQARMFADRFRKIAAEYSIKRNKNSFNITLSAGLCQFGHGADDYQGLLNRCNEALAESNKKGNVTTIYGHGDDKEQNNE